MLLFLYVLICCSVAFLFAVIYLFYLIFVHCFIIFENLHELKKVYFLNINGSNLLSSFFFLIFLDMMHINAAVWLWTACTCVCVCVCVCVCSYNHVCYVSFRCEFWLVMFHLLFIQKALRICLQSVPVIFSVLFFPLWDVKLQRYLASSVSWYNNHWFSCFSSPPSHSLCCFWEFFQRFPVDLIIETFQQIAGENRTPKLVASRGKITMLLTSVQIS